MKLTAIAAVLATCFLLVFAGTAVAQSTPTQDAYSGIAGQQEGGSSGGGPATFTSSPESSSGGSLPFTGSNLALIGLAGVGLLGTGLLVRRASRPSA